MAMSPEAACQVLVTLPSDLAALALITILPRPDVGAAAKDSKETPSDRELALWQAVTVQQVHSMQPGGAASAAFAALHAQPGGPAVHVVCHKAKAVAILKALAGVREQLRLRVSKESLSLRLSSQELQSAVHAVLIQTLLRAGWSQLSDSFLLRSCILSAAEGQVCACSSLTLQTAPQPPNKILLSIQPGTARFRPLSVRGLLPRDATLPTAATSEADTAAFNAKLWSMQIPCTILPDCRPALLAGVRPTAVGAEGTEMRQRWLLHTGWELPSSFPHLLDVRFTADEDDPVLSVPSCCVWGPTGLFNMVGGALGKGDDSVHPALRQLARDIRGSPFQFWAGLPSVALVTGSTGTAPGSVTASGWASAKDVGGSTGQPGGGQAEELTLLDLSTLAEEDAPTAAAATPGPALQRYLKSIAQADVAGSSVQRPLAISVRQQPAAPLQRHFAWAPAFGKRSGPAAALLQGLSAASEPQETDACAPNGLHAAAMQAGTLAAAPELGRTAGAAKPVFASRKRPGMPAAMAAHKAPAAKKPKEAPCVKKPAAAKQPKTAAASSPKAAAAADMAQPATAPVLARSMQQAPATAAAEKAPMAAAGKPPPRKRTKAGDLDAAAVEAKVLAQHAAGALDKLSMPEMKCALKARKLPVSGKKADLVARLAETLAREE